MTGHKGKMFFRTTGDQMFIWAVLEIKNLYNKK